MQPISGTPTETIQAEMDAVLQQCLRVAADYLSRFDTFIPFAILYREDTNLERIEVMREDGSTEVESQEAYDALVPGFVDRAAELHAVGVVSDVTLSQDDEAQGSAVRVELEHRDEASRVLVAWARYTRDDAGAVTFAEELGTSDGERRIWA